MGKETTNSKKKRLDILLVERGLVPTRSLSKSLIMEGKVYVNDLMVDKPGTFIDANAEITIKENEKRYVSRGGIKLEAAIDHFGIDVSGITALDIGASTGGFTDCLLRKGAKKVYAFDVGYGQIDWKLRNDPRVIVKERINCRYLKPEDVGEKVNLVVIDVSFISLSKIIPPALKVLKSKGRLIALIKPQFEVGKGRVGKGGIVRDKDKHEEVIQKIEDLLEKYDCFVEGVIPSPITGADGNKEFLVSALVP